MRSGGARRRRIARWAAVGLVVAFGLFVALDVVAAQYLASRGSSQIVRTMSALEAEVDMGGFPFLPGFVRGRMTDVDVHVRGATATGGLRIQAIDVRLPEVRFSPRDAFSLSRSIFATRTEVTAVQPIGTVEVSEEDLEDYISRRIPLVESLEIGEGRIAVRFDAELAGLDPPERGDDEDEEDEEEDELVALFVPRVEEGRFVLSLVSARLPQPLRQEAERIETLVSLPEIPAGLRSTVRVGNGVVVIESEGAEGEDITVSVGEGERR